MSEGVVVVDYTSSAESAAKNVRYIAHREQQSSGRELTLRGLGGYESVRDAGSATARLRADAAGLRRAKYYRVKLTVPDEVAARLARLGPTRSEEVLYRAASRAIQSVNQKLQGVLAVHGNGGAGRPFGHPHVHGLVSPRYSDGRSVSSLEVERLKASWYLALERELPERQVVPPRLPSLGEGLKVRPEPAPAAPSPADRLKTLLSGRDR